MEGFHQRLPKKQVALWNILHAVGAKHPWSRNASNLGIKPFSRFGLVQSR